MARTGFAEASEAVALFLPSSRIQMANVNTHRETPRVQRGGKLLPTDPSASRHEPIATRQPTKPRNLEKVQRPGHPQRNRMRCVTPADSANLVFSSDETLARMLTKREYTDHLCSKLEIGHVVKFELFSASVTVSFIFEDFHKGAPLARGLASKLILTVHWWLFASRLILTSLGQKGQKLVTSDSDGKRSGGTRPREVRRAHLQKHQSPFFALGCVSQKPRL